MSEASPTRDEAVAYLKASRDWKQKLGEADIARAKFNEMLADPSGESLNKDEKARLSAALYFRSVALIDKAIEALEIPF